MRSPSSPRRSSPAAAASTPRRAAASSYKAADGRIKASFSGADGELVLVHEGHVKWRGKGKHVFWLDDYRGADMVMVRVTAPDGKVCSARRTLRHKQLVASGIGSATVPGVTGTPSGYGSATSVRSEGIPMSTTTALAGTFASDPVHSSFGFAVKYQNVSIFRGTLGEVNATLVDGKLDGVAEVESISIRTPEQFRAHVLSADFFDVENHPQVKFVSEDVAAQRRRHRDRQRRPDDPRGHAGRDRHRHAGSAPSEDAFGNTRAHLQLEAVVDRTVFGLNWNMDLPTGGKALGNDVTLTVDLALVQQG